MHRPTCEFDRQAGSSPDGRLAELAGLKGIRFARRFDHLEVWDKQRWAEYLAASAAGMTK